MNLTKFISQDLVDYMKKYNYYQSWQIGDRLQFKEIPEHLLNEEVITVATDGGYIHGLRNIPKAFRTEEVCLGMIARHRTNGNFSAVPKELLTPEMYLKGVSTSPSMLADALQRSRKKRPDQSYTLDDVELCIESLAPLQYGKARYEELAKAGVNVGPVPTTEAEWRKFAQKEIADMKYPITIPYDLLHDALLHYRDTKLLNLEPGEASAILCEMHQNGKYLRFALTRDEFAERFAGFKMQEPSTNGTYFELRPLVTLWYRAVVLNGPAWEIFFHDMADGIPEEDIADGNVATVYREHMGVLERYL